MRATADDVLVCRHDPVVEDGRFVIAMTAAETTPSGCSGFADLLDGLPPATGIDVEVKSSLEDALRPRERTTAALVGRALAGREGSRAAAGHELRRRGARRSRASTPPSPRGC